MIGSRRYTCQVKRESGKDVCIEDCPALKAGVFEYARIEASGDLPPADPRTVDVAILDMNHGWPNLGHDSIVQAVQDAACDLGPCLEPLGMKVRALSFEVRRMHQIPEPPGGRFALYVGTGGPGHIDPRFNDGSEGAAQGVSEDPAWEKPLFRLFDGIRDDGNAALLGVCHSFGVMCRWSGVAQPVLRSAAKGGKSAGILENLLTPEAVRHPWFHHFSEDLPDGRRLRIVDHRLYDLIPQGERLPGGAIAIGRETRGVDGPAGDALTMVEWARDRGGVMPRVFGVNHHPEIVDRSRQMMILKQKLERGEVTPEWCAERVRIMQETYPDDARDLRLHLTSDYTLMGPLRYHLFRQVRLRAAALGHDLPIHEDQILQAETAAVVPGAMGTAPH